MRMLILWEHTLFNVNSNIFHRGGTSVPKFMKNGLLLREKSQHHNECNEQTNERANERQNEPTNQQRCVTTIPRGGGVIIQQHQYCIEQGCPTFLTGLPSVQISNQSGARSRCRRRRGGKGMGRGCPPPQPTRGSGGASYSPTAGSGGPGRKRVLVYFRAWKNTPDRHKFIIFLPFLEDLAGRIETPSGPDCGCGPYVGHSWYRTNATTHSPSVVYCISTHIHHYIELSAE